MAFRYAVWTALAGMVLAAGAVRADTCVECHRKTTPNIVSDWQLSKHSQNAVTCDACHGGEHQSATDAAKAKIPTAETCGQCHADRVGSV